MSELKKITDEIRDKLREPFPPECITQHPTKPYLSTIKAIYIAERLNDVFGVGGWNLESEVVERTEDYILVGGHIVLKDYDVVTQYQYGGHKTTGKNTEIADGYKSAITDCISKCASYLEVGIDVFKGNKAPKKDKSPKKDTSGLITDDQFLHIDQIIFDKGIETKEFLSYLSTGTNLDIKKVHDIPAEHYKFAVDLLNKAHGTK